MKEIERGDSESNSLQMPTLAQKKCTTFGAYIIVIKDKRGGWRVMGKWIALQYKIIKTLR